jgi:ubiquinone/menaquinone biosynthesis C-methylase UbiE
MLPSYKLYEGAIMKIDEKRFFTMADTYNQLAQELVPQYDFLQNEAINILDYKTDDEIVVIDLGAGTGIFLEKILNKYKNARCYYVDYSDDFITVAKKKLESFKDRVIYIKASFNGEWQNEIDEKADAIFSMSAIHHLTNENKKALYKKCYELLKNRGWFINIDEMKTINEDAYYSSLIMWWDYFNKAKHSVDKEKNDYLKQWENHFTNWKIRNIDNIAIEKGEGDDMHESFLYQIDWLKDIGFINADLFIKYHLWCVIGGRKAS